jgi:hypothetical protein
VEIFSVKHLLNSSLNTIVAGQIIYDRTCELGCLTRGQLLDELNSISKDSVVTADEAYPGSTR